MHAVRRLVGLVAALAAVSLAFAGPALAASPFNTLFHEYQSTGGIKACKHSTAELQAAENQVPPDITQYAPDFPAALQAALETRAHGGCGGAGAAAGSLAVASPIAQAASHAGGGGASSAPAPLIALAVLMIVLALAAVWWTVTTVRGTETARTSAAGHALGEVRLRAGGTLREFADWLRLGR
jgi:hypothetical protein